MINSKYNFSAVYLTKNYYPMFDGCIYKHSLANFNNINVVNVDMGSTAENFVNGEEVCSKLGIKMADNGAISYQEGIDVADRFMTQENINTDWVICFQHDVFPLKKTFWDDLQNVLDVIDDDKVGMIGGNSFSNYANGLSATQNNDIVDGCFGKTKTGRGMLANDMLQEPYSGWYKNLPNDYYKSKYFVVESPYWCCFVINRKLFREHINVDSNFIFELWPDDLAYQFMSKGIVNISVPNLFVSHDHKFKDGVDIKGGDLVEPRHDFNPSQMRFWEKWGFRWGIRNSDVRKQFNEKKDDIYDENALQPFFFNLNINDGPLDIDLKSRPPLL